MKQLVVNEVFYSLQGEGARAGVPSIFIRLTGCDMTCGFCDTEFASGESMTIAELLERCHRASATCGWIVWTGGEPMLQLTPEVTKVFAEAGYAQAVETNGNHPVPEGMFNWVAVSPKVAEHVLEKNFPNGVSELRYVRGVSAVTVPKPSIGAQAYYLSPMSDGQLINGPNLRHCIDLCLKNPKWRLSVQLHKLWKVQ